MGEKKTKTFADTYEDLGVMLGPVSEGNRNAKSDCPFCRKDGHFFVNVDNGQYSCKVCAREGNVFTFFKEFAEHMEAHTGPGDFDDLSQKRGIPADAFPEWGVSLNYLTGEWIIPMFSDKGTVREIRRTSGVKGEGVQSTSGCKTQLGGLYLLATTKDLQKRRVWVCEGDWDGFAMRWLLKQAGSHDIVVWAPGSGTFKDEWVPWFKDLDVVWVYDNDQSGDDGSRKGSSKLEGIARSQTFVSWPETFPRKWDVSNQLENGLKRRMDARVILTDIEALVTTRHRRDETEAGSEVKEQISKEIGPPCTFSEVLTTFKKWIKPMDRDFMDCLMIALAVPLANMLPGEPLWFYMIGVPSSGKTTILNAMALSDRCSFHSSVRKTSFVSGFRMDPDPSLFNKINGKTAIFKDGTTLLAMHPDERRELFAILREAFDGNVDSKPFGNGVSRAYKDLNFNVLIGVTPAIRGDIEANKGERFLNIEMRENQASAVQSLYQCYSNSMKEREMSDELRNVCARFLNREINADNLPKIPESYVHRIVAMAQIVALLRAQVERDPRDNSLKYRAAPEGAKRVLKQMVKLARVLAIVLGKVEVDADVCRLLRKVMADTSVGFHVDIVKSFIRVGNEPLTPQDLARASQMTSDTLRRRLDDMLVLGILECHRREAPKGETVLARYSLSDRLMSLWKQAEDGIPRGS